MTTDARSIIMQNLANKGAKDVTINNLFNNTNGELEAPYATHAGATCKKK